MTELNHQELAKQGNPEAIASLIEGQLQSEGIAATANLSGDCLEIIIESDDRVPPQDKSVELIRSELANLQPESIRAVKVEGREKGQLAPAWTQEFSWDASTFSKLTLASESVPVALTAPSRSEMETAGDIEVKEAMLVGFENRLRSTLIVVGIVTGILAVAVVAFVNKTWNLAAANAGNSQEETANLVTAPDPFRDAVNKAVKAAELGRSAKSKDDWISAAERWQEAVSLMRRVPPSSPNHEVAQTKVVEYQKYLVYAQESAASPPPPAATPATAETATPEKASRKKSTSDKAASEKEGRKKSTSDKAASESENRKESTAQKENPKKSTSEKADSETTPSSR